MRGVCSNPHRPDLVDSQKISERLDIPAFLAGMSSRWPDEQTLLRRQHFYIKALRSSTMRILNVGDGQSWHDIQVLSGPRSYQVYTWRESAGLRILKGAHRLSRNMPKRTGRPRASFLSRKSQSLHSTLPESACCLAQVWTSPASRR